MVALQALLEGEQEPLDQLAGTVESHGMQVQSTATGPGAGVGGAGVGAGGAGVGTGVGTGGDGVTVHVFDPQSHEAEQAV